MEQLLPDQLKALWQAVDQQQLSLEAFTSEQERLLAAYRQTWEQALLLEEYKGLSESLLAELGAYMRCTDMAEIQRRWGGTEICWAMDPERRAAGERVIAAFEASRAAVSSA